MSVTRIPHKTVQAASDAFAEAHEFDPMQAVNIALCFSVEAARAHGLDDETLHELLSVVQAGE